VSLVSFFTRSRATQALDAFPDDDVSDLLTADDGLPIPPSIEEYVAVRRHGSTVTLSVADAKKHAPEVANLRRFLERRAADPSHIVLEAVLLEQIRILKHGKAAGRTDTVPNQDRSAAIFKLAAGYGASDIHVLQQDNGTVGIFFRIDGDLYPSGIDLPPGDAADLLRTGYTMSDFRSKKGHFTVDEAAQTAILTNLADFGLDRDLSAIRCQFKETLRGPEAAYRLQPLEQAARRLEDLGVRPDQVATLKWLIRLPFGAFLLCGPVGSGKTALAAALMEYWTGIFPNKILATIEDPPEIRLRRASQHPLNEQDPKKRPDRFVAMLRMLLRSDANFVFSSECRDAESGSAFLEAALTGFPVMSTIHAPMPHLIPERLRCWHIDEATLRDPTILRALIGTRLVKRLCPHCKIPLLDAARAVPPGDDLRDTISTLSQYIELSPASSPSTVTAFGTAFTRNRRGCDRCRRTHALAGVTGGAVGRRQIAEIIRPNRTLLEMLARGEATAGQEYLRRTMRVPSLWDEAVSLIEAGELCPLDAVDVLGDPPLDLSEQ
jgi:general secretion pathway protein E